MWLLLANHPWVQDCDLQWAFGKLGQPVALVGGQPGQPDLSWPSAVGGGAEQCGGLALPA